MNGFKFFIFSLFLLCSVTNANVIVEYRGGRVTYDENPRLTDVVARFLLTDKVYWHNAGLYDLRSQEFKTKKRELLDEIKKVKFNTGVKTSKWQSLNQIESTLSSWQIAHRLNLSVDYDLLRYREELNPLLDDGEYLLWLPFRKFTVEIFGAVESNTLLPHKATAHVADYLDQEAVKRLDYADSEYVYVIHRNGSFKKVSLGLHNRDHVEVPPDGMIYIPLKELPFDSTNESINAAIAQLAGNRLP